MITLENEYLKASFALKGAELQSLKSKKNQQEYIWQADPQYWAKHSPVLFPIVGALKNNTYCLDGKAYKLSRHGFARDLDFEPEQLSNTEVVFTLKQSEETLKVYPFKFRLRLIYKLLDNTLFCTYDLSNPADQPLLFSIGGHPAFATPAENDSGYSDYQLHFNRDAELKYNTIQDNLISEETRKIELENQTLQLRHDLFYNDALVFKSLRSDEITLSSKSKGDRLIFAFEGFPYFGVWAAKDANFVCLEPWCGLADGINHDQQLKTKEGIIALQAQESWTRIWSVKIILPEASAS